MVYRPLTWLDPANIQKAQETLQRLFGIESLRSYQERAGQNVLLGRNTFLDIPTGGGKTLPFYFPLFYHWQPGITAKKAQKIILVIGPLSGLMKAQARTLVEKGVPAVALTGTTEDLVSEMKAFGSGKYRVGFVGPEMALEDNFHKHVLENSNFQKNIIAAVVDEAHNISEWGTDDFRPEFRRISALLGRLPQGLPVLAASATVAPEVMADIEDQLGIGGSCERISVSNAKMNVSLSVRLLQHPPDSYADLLSIFPQDPICSEDDFPQTLIFVNGRTEAEHIQDFLREHAPAELPGVRFEFYHRYIADDRKAQIEKGLEDGTLSGVPATDALAMGMDFRRVKRVYFWMPPRTFNSLIQKIGRCVRVFTELGEAVLFITRAAFSCLAVEFDIESADREEEQENQEEQEVMEPEFGDIESDEDEDEDEEDEVAMDEDEMDEEEDVDMDSEPANEAGETQEPSPAAEENSSQKRRPVKRKKGLNRIQARDRWYLMWFILTTKCRRIVWDKFYRNHEKGPSPFPTAHGFVCCDNCDPSKFPSVTIKLTDPDQLRLPGRQRKSSPELFEAVAKQLRILRDEIVVSTFGARQGLISGSYIMQDNVIQVLGERARAIDSISAIKQRVRWHWVDAYGQQVVDAIAGVLVDFPDAAMELRDTERREKALRKLLGMAKKDLREKISKVSEACFAAVEGCTRSEDDSTQLCHLFLKLPRKNRGTIYTSITEYAEDWYRMFANARTFNIEGSQIYDDANTLEEVFNSALRSATRIHGIMVDSDEIETDVEA